MKVILNLQKRWTSIWDFHQRKILFVVDVSVARATNRTWQAELLDTSKVTQA